MFMFVSPFARLFRDHDYKDVIDGAVQRLPPDLKNPERTIWIYRYYDSTSTRLIDLVAADCQSNRLLQGCVTS
jgi:hypothetical protein